MENDAAEVAEVKRRRHLDEACWRDVIERFPASGLTLKSFCRQERVCVSSYRRWRERLSGKVKAAPVTAKTGRMEQRAAGYIELGEVGTGGMHAPMELRLDLGGGMSLHLVRR
jgi:hypothetical protein